ncbi:MAG TPA: hypothetical protein VK063_12910 [Beutenbergiaceae bacterium]|nr:hypothetical protein [Beutenbergiaceae bacterium]
MDTITVDIDGRIASWRAGQFTGDPEVVAAAGFAIEHGQTVAVFDQVPIEARADEPLGALAALSAFNPGRVFVTELPEAVANWLTAVFDQDQCGASAASGH